MVGSRCLAVGEKPQASRPLCIASRDALMTAIRGPLQAQLFPSSIVYLVGMMRRPPLRAVPERQTFPLSLGLVRRGVYVGPKLSALGVPLGVRWNPHSFGCLPLKFREARAVVRSYNG